MDLEHPRGLMFLTAAFMECPTGEVLTHIRFEQKTLPDKSAYFRYVYGCVYAGEDDMEYETIKNDLTAFYGENEPQHGSINYLDKQIVRCPESSGFSVFLTAVTMELDFETDTLRYVYKCGKVYGSINSVCEGKSTLKHQAKDLFVLNLEHLGITCYPNEGLTKFQLRVECEPDLLLWYEFTCCKPTHYGLIISRPSPRNSF